MFKFIAGVVVGCTLGVLAPKMASKIGNATIAATQNVVDVARAGASEIGENLSSQ